MKKIITSFIILIAGFSASAQNIQLFDKDGNEISGDTITTWYAVDTAQSFIAPFEFKKFVSVYNNSNDTISIDVVREKLQGITGTSDQLCWGTNCYVEPQGGLTTWTINDPVKTNPNDTAAGDIPISVYLDSKKNVGEAYFRYDFYQVNASRPNSASLTVNFSLSYLTGLSEEEIAQFGFDVYPNPVTNNAIIKFKTALSFREQYIEVLDIAGKRVDMITVPVGAVNQELNVEGISSGIYFVRLVAEGVQVETKKIVFK